MAWHNGLYNCQQATRQKNQWEFRYLISNRSNDKVPHIQSYDKRWAIEVFFGSVKQDFGLSDCQARSLVMQMAHIIAVCFAFLKREKSTIKNQINAKKRPLNRKIIEVPMLRTHCRSMDRVYA
jgi:hypothetical protein